MEEEFDELGDRQIMTVRKEKKRWRELRELSKLEQKKNTFFFAPFEGGWCQPEIYDYCAQSDQKKNLPSSHLNKKKEK